MSLVIEYKNIQQFCRICFDLKPNLVPSYTKLIFESYTCTIEEVLKLLSQEEENPNFPIGICAECRELVLATFMLKIKYTQTSENLKNSFASLQVDNLKLEVTSDNNDNEVQNSEKSDTENNAETEATPQQSVQSQTSAFVCPICRKEYDAALSLRCHIHAHKSLRVYLKGNRVPKKSVFVAKPRKNMSLFNRSEIFHRCPTCCEHFSIEHFCRHVETHRSQEGYSCDKCDRLFRRSSHLNIHRVRAHLDEYPFRCEACNKGFVIKKNFDCHLLTHTTQELPFKCDHCFRTFSNPEHLHRHMFIHTENISYGVKYKVYRCTFCKNSFRTLTDLREHRLQCKERRQRFTSSNKASKKYCCLNCPKSYVTIESLENHRRLKHTNNETQKSLCSVCGKCVTNLNIHMASHNEDRAYKCSSCPKTFSTKTVLKQHLLVHSGEKPYVCSTCGKTFNNFYNLQVHERIHRGDKCHKCICCGKGFLEKSYLNKHMRIHRNI